MYLPKPSTREGCNTLAIFKQTLTGLNSEFSYYKTGCHIKVKIGQ